MAEVYNEVDGEVALCFVWDGVRTFDYLLARPEPINLPFFIAVTLKIACDRCSRGNQTVPDAYRPHLSPLG
ncbi:MAG: hypothetical protein NTV52_00840 [Acidobacteria bacterium]|nr:hypothetical protein [Acidobacteriota bacterium]